MFAEEHLSAIDSQGVEPGGWQIKILAKEGRGDRKASLESIRRKAIVGLGVSPWGRVGASGDRQKVTVLTNCGQGIERRGCPGVFY
jgi:hypothetical protein